MELSLVDHEIGTFLGSREPDITLSAIWLACEITLFTRWFSVEFTIFMRSCTVPEDIFSSKLSNKSGILMIYGFSVILKSVWIIFSNCFKWLSPTVFNDSKHRKFYSFICSFIPQNGRGAHVITRMSNSAC